MADNTPSTARAAVGMGVITAVSRALGFVRVLVVLVVLGTTWLGNAFNSANLVSNILFELLAAGALSAVLVPTFVNYLEKDRQREAEEVAGGVLGVALLLLGIVTFFGVVGAGWVARLLTLNVDPASVEAQRELVTYLLRFFVPQIMLYAAGTIATAVLYAYRRFAVTAAAPIGNTVVMVACLIAFRLVAGPGAGLELDSTERWLLVAAGTGGVVAFNGSLLLACAQAGFRLRPRWPGRDRRVFELLKHSGWGVALHSAAGMLLGGAVVVGSAVEGGVPAYHFAWVVFLAPYGVMAQPIHTAVLPEMATEAREHGPRRVVMSVRWAAERIALLVLPVSMAMIVLAEPAMRLIRMGEVTEDGVGLLAASLAGLAVGLFGYSVMLLLARSFYALDDSRTPGVVALGCGAAGVVMMAVGAFWVDGVALVAVLGLGHSAAYTLGMLILGRGLARRGGVSPWSPVLFRITLVTLVAGALAWATVRGLEEGPLSGLSGRPLDIVLLLAGGLVGAAVVAAGYRVGGVMARLTPRSAEAGGQGPTPDVPGEPEESGEPEEEAGRSVEPLAAGPTEGEPEGNP